MVESYLVIAGFGFAAYLLGAIPNGYLIAQARGIDIRKVGSGNIGATNVFRSVGKSWGILTFAADALKGFVPAWGFPWLARQWFPSLPPGAVAGLALTCAVLAIVGHTWPVYLGFKGGKGVATSAGALLGIAPLAVAFGLVVWVAVFLASRYVSLASLAAALTAAAAGWLCYRHQGLLLPATLSLLALLIVWRHRGNLQRLRNGTEHRFEFGKKTSSEM